MRSIVCRSGFLPKSYCSGRAFIEIDNFLDEACKASLEPHHRNGSARVDDHEQHRCIGTGSMSKGKQFKEIINCS